jgi:hypothetical protein
MLPDFPNIKAKIIKDLNQYIRKLTSQDSFMSTIKAEKHFEGNKMLSIMSDGQKDETEYREFRTSTIEINKTDVLTKGGPQCLLEHAQSMAEELKQQKSKLLFETLNSITDKSGQITQGKGELTPNVLLEALDKLEIDFDENGQFEAPSLVVSPEMYAKLQSKIPEWDKDVIHRKKYDALIERKRKEWNDRESNRKLVD